MPEIRNTFQIYHTRDWKYYTGITCQRLENTLQVHHTKDWKYLSATHKRDWKQHSAWHAHDRKYHQGHHARDWKYYAGIPYQRMEIPSHDKMPETGNTFQVYHANFKSYQSFSGILR
jgi:hypothetical protein